MVKASSKAIESSDLKKQKEIKMGDSLTQQRIPSADHTIVQRSFLPARGLNQRCHGKTAKACQHIYYSLLVSLVSANDTKGKLKTIKKFSGLCGTQSECTGSFFLLIAS